MHVKEYFEQIRSSMLTVEVELTRFPLSSFYSTLFDILIQEEDCPGQEADNYTVHVLTAQTQSYLCTHRVLRNVTSMEVVLTITTTTDTLALNRHYSGIIEAQNKMGGRNSSNIHFSKLYAVDTTKIPIPG